MKIEDLYEFVRNLWPESVNIGDAEVGTSGKPTGLFPQLAKANCSAEDAAENVKPCNDLYGLAVWSFYQEIHEIALRSHRTGMAQLSPGDVSIAMLDARLRANLETEGWEDVRLSYERANPPDKK